LRCAFRQNLSTNSSNKRQTILYNNQLDQLIITALSAQSIEALAEQFPFAITAEEKKEKAEIRISGAIHNWNNSAEWFRSQIQAFNDKGIAEASLYISTPGGDVFQAAEIHNEIKAFNGKIKGYGGVMVASAGTYIRLACDEFEMVSNGKWMYHKPEGGIRGNEDAWESRLKLLQNITSDYRKGYADLTGLTEDQIEKKWAKGDVWLTPEEAKAEGWITGISKYKAKITEKETALFTACGTPNPPKPTAKSKLNTNIEMDLKVTALSLGLPETATEAEVKAKMADLQAKAQKADALEQAAQDKEKADKSAKIKAMLDKGFEEKKFTAKQRESLEKFADVDFEACEAHVESLPNLEKISDTIAGKSKGKKTVVAKDKKYEDMTDDEREVLAEEDPELFEAKYTAYLEN